MSNIESRFREHVTQCQEYSSLRLSEADTRAYLIDPLLRILGYDGIRDLRREVSVPATKEAVDYQLMIDGQPLVIVEAKALQYTLTDQHAAQCVQYASVLGVRWCLITNGLTWAVYDAQGKGPLAEKRVAQVRLDTESGSIDEAWAVLGSFSKATLATATPLTNLLVERVVADELARPDSRAVEALRRAIASRFGERVSGQAVVGAIYQVMTKLGSNSTAFTPGFSTSTAEADLQNTNQAESPPPPEVGRRSESARRAWETRRQNQTPVSRRSSKKRTTISDLVDAEIIPANAILTATIRV